MARKKRKRDRIVSEPVRPEKPNASGDVDMYGPIGAFKRNRRKVFDLLEEVELLLEGPLPEETDFTHVGNVVEARYHLEQAVRHLKTHGYKEDRQ